MSMREIERELAAVLHRHAEDAITGTDTVAEHQRFQAELELDTGSRVTARNRWAVAVAATAVVVAAIGGWALGRLEDDGDVRPAGPSTRMSDAEIAQAFVEAYGAGDAVRAATYLAPGHVPYDGWDRDIERNVAWGVTFLFDSCEVTAEGWFGSAVLCPFDLHVMHSDAVGKGPFTGNTFTVFVKDGAVTEAEDQMPWETNGQGEYIDAVNAWVQRNHPQEWELLNPDESEAGAQWDRWLRTWGHVLDAYLQAKTGRSAE
jgi:hypothetical protein